MTRREFFCIFSLPSGDNTMDGRSDGRAHEEIV